ncbi:MAG: hypothetical protein IJC21_01040 [Lentisphaeria bacterium]|nr:hypothetical protein [Lentisphaeria bacterium]
MATSSSTLNMFFSEYIRGLDPQCRVSLPSEWRSGETEFVMLPTVKQDFLLFPLPMFKRLFDHVSEQAIADVALQEARAFLGSQSRFCRCDKQGRMALDKAKLEESGIVGEVKLIGAVSHIRLTAANRWNTPVDDNSVGRYFDAINKASTRISPAFGTILGGMAGNGDGK